MRNILLEGTEFTHEFNYTVSKSCCFVFQIGMGLPPPIDNSGGGLFTFFLIPKDSKG